MVVFTILELTKIFVVGKFIYLAILGFVVTAVAGVIFTLLSPSSSKYYGKDNWELEPNDTNREKVELNEFDIQVLSLIRFGHQYMSDITDGLKVDSKVSTESIEKLDRGGYIKRAGKTGSSFYTFELADRAYTILPRLSSKEEELEKNYLNSKYLNFLKAVFDSPKAVANIVKEQKYASLQVSSIVSHLVRRGYLIEKGLYKRQLVITERGKDIIQKYS